MLGPKTTMILQKRTLVADNIGGYEETWKSKASFTGLLSLTKGEENTINNKTTVVSTHVFFIDYPKGDIIPEERDRFLIGTTEYEILFVGNPGNCNHHLEIKLRKLT